MLLQVPFLTWYIWYIHSATHGETGTKKVNFKPISITRIFAMRPTCKELSIQNLWNWVNFVVCFPFSINFQGVSVTSPTPALTVTPTLTLPQGAWANDVNTPDPMFSGSNPNPNPNLNLNLNLCPNLNPSLSPNLNPNLNPNPNPDPMFLEVYGPLFKKYSPRSGCGFGYLFGPFLLAQKFMVVIVLGSSVSKKSIATPADSAGQLLGLSVLQLLQFLFIVIERPFNEYFENLVQAVVTFAQGAFFASMWLSALKTGPEGEGLGEFLNFCNLLAVAVVTAASIKSQA